MSIENTLAERGNRYGDFTDHARICQQLKNTMYNANTDRGLQLTWEKLSDVQKQALEVIADKIARILSGDPNYADNWHDIQGYAKLVEDRLPRPAEAVYDTAKHLQGVQDMAITFGQRVAIMNAYIQAGDTGETYTEYEARMLGKAQAPIDPADVGISGEIPPDQWQKGDVVECMENHSNQFTKGWLYALDRDNTPRSIMVLADDRGESNGWGTENFRFHSRPTK